jgi:putative membrane protein, TIGR04086 family/integral membrane protein, TIGR04097 family
MEPIRTVTRSGSRMPLLYGLFAAILWLGAGALILSLLLRYSGLKETALPTLALLVHGISSLAGGFTTGRRAGHKGWYFGLLLGALYALIVLAIGFLAADAPLSLESLSLLATAAGAGTIGGMFGVGTRR